MHNASTAGSAAALGARTTAASGSAAAAPSVLPGVWDLFGPDGIAPRLLLLAKMIERATSRRLQAEFGLSVAQWRVLAFTCLSGPATAAFIGEAAEVDQAEISRAVKGLTERGWVTREFEPGNRKTRIIAPTLEGRRHYEAIRESRQAYFRRITRKLAPADRRAFGSALDLVAREVVAERGQRG